MSSAVTLQQLNSIRASVRRRS